MAILPTLILGPSLILKTISSEEGGICRTSGWTVANCRPRSDRYSLIDRKSTRLNSSHRCISYAVFCLEKMIAAASLFTTSRWAVQLHGTAFGHRPENPFHRSQENPLRFRFLSFF